MQISRRAGLLALAAMLAAPPLAQAQDQAVRIVFPFTAGGSGDALARLISDKLAAALGRPVVVDNRTGAAGRIGVVAVKNAAPDGGTLLITPIAPVAVMQHVYPNLEYDPFKDLAPVSQLATFDFAVGVGSHVPAQSVKELVAWVKADPSRAAFGSPAAGALPHFFGVLFGRAAGLELQHVAYRGSAAAVSDLVAGHVPMVFTTLSDLLEQHKAGRVRILAVSGAARSPFLPAAPTFREFGLRHRRQRLVRRVCARRHARGGDRALQQDHGGRRPLAGRKGQAARLRIAAHRHHRRRAGEDSARRLGSMGSGREGVRI